VPSGDRGYDRTGILRDTYQATIASAVVITPPRIKVVIDGKIIFGSSAAASYPGAAGFGWKNGANISFDPPVNGCVKSRSNRAER
jgi:hypothetical protein